MVYFSVTAKCANIFDVFKAYTWCKFVSVRSMGSKSRDMPPMSAIERGDLTRDICRVASSERRSDGPNGAGNFVRLQRQARQ